MRSWQLIRQEAEGLVDLLEEKPDEVLHDKPRKELAAELREMFGMTPFVGAPPTERDPLPDLHCDPMREDQYRMSGIHVRAYSLRDGWGSYDLSQLKADDLKIWLRSRDPCCDWAVHTVLIILGYKLEDMKG
jgi:hypothetical protein